MDPAAALVDQTISDRNGVEPATQPVAVYAASVVDGMAVGGGVDLIGTCDIVLASDSSAFSIARPSRSMEMTKPSDPTASANSRVCPPAPSVPSTKVCPGCGDSHWRTSPASTGT